MWVEDDIAAIIDVSRLGTPRLVPPESFFMFAIPVVINESRPWRDNHGYQDFPLQICTLHRNVHTRLRMGHVQACAGCVGYVARPDCGELGDRVDLEHAGVTTGPYLVVDCAARADLASGAVRASCAATLLAQRGVFTTPETMTLPLRVENALWSCVIYIRQTVVPLRLSAFYPTDLDFLLRNIGVKRPAMCMAMPHKPMPSRSDVVKPTKGSTSLRTFASRIA